MVCWHCLLRYWVHIRLSVYEPESELKTAVAGERIMLRTQGQDEDYDINAGVTGELVKTIVEEETEETTESLP